jgi:hypothetical protein
MVVHRGRPASDPPAWAQASTAASAPHSVQEVTAAAQTQADADADAAHEIEAAQPPTVRTTLPTGPTPHGAVTAKPRPDQATMAGLSACIPSALARPRPKRRLNLPSYMPTIGQVYAGCAGPLPEWWNDIEPPTELPPWCSWVHSPPGSTTVVELAARVRLRRCQWARTAMVNRTAS